MRSFVASISLAVGLIASAGAANALVISAPSVNMSSQVEHTYNGQNLNPPDYQFFYRTDPGTLTVNTNLDTMVGSLDFSGIPTMAVSATGIRPLNSGFTTMGVGTVWNWLVEAPSIAAADLLELKGDAVHVAGQYALSATGLGDAEALLLHEGGFNAQVYQYLGFARCQPYYGQSADCGTHDFDVALTLYRVTDTLFTGRFYASAAAYTRPLLNQDLQVSGPYGASTSIQLSIYLDPQFAAQNPGFTVTNAVMSDLLVEHPREPPIPIDDVPEPSAWALLILGFGVSGVALRRKRWAWTGRTAV